eukprot:scaffold62666_cov36-Phaeocystis_antarctica.AAC.1
MATAAAASVYALGYTLKSGGRGRLSDGCTRAALGGRGRLSGGRLPGGRLSGGDGGGRGGGAAGRQRGAADAPRLRQGRGALPRVAAACGAARRPG